MSSSWLKDFTAPGSEYRGKPFWAWNGKLEPEELRRQIRHMRRMGLGGFFMHSRVGLDTAYLSDDWFRCVDACVEEARALGMEAWMYDEDRWPSGAAGGLVTKNPAYRMRHLTYQILKPGDRPEDRGEVIAVFAARLEGEKAASVRQLPKEGNHKAEKGESLLVFSVKVQGESSWYNGQTYLDTMNPEAVREFIKVTHEAYRKNNGGEFGKTIPGMFTDEPNYAHFYWNGTKGAPQYPWTGKLPEVFRKRYGYDLLEHLPELAFDVEGTSFHKIRHNYFDCITHLFVDSFMRQNGEWCEKNGIAFTGHVNAEDTLTSQSSSVGSCMRCYEHMQAPGMDLLTSRWRVYDTAKQVSSAARQFGNKWRLTETYGCTGWDFPFSGHKALGDWQAALGINLRCQHLSWYTMEGQAKRDYPAGIFYQSPWWDSYVKVEDYFARIHSVMTRGEEVRDLLVIHPVESLWIETGYGERPATAKLNEMFIDLRDSLLTANIDFDYGDEELLSRHASVTAAGGKPLLRMGKATYRAVIVPPLKTIRRSTLELLQKFRAKGGVVVFAGKCPELVDAEPCADAKAFSRECLSAPAKGDKLPQAVETACRLVSIKDKDGKEIDATLHLLREDKDAYYLFVVNTGHAFRRETNAARIYIESAVENRTLSFPEAVVDLACEAKGKPLELNPETGEIFAAEAKSGKDGWKIKTSFPALGSRLFIFPRQADNTEYPVCPKLKDARAQLLKPKNWTPVLSEPNVLVLDRPAYKVANGGWQKSEEVLRVDFAVRDKLEIARRGGAMVQPWAQTDKADGKTTEVSLRYSFDVAALPSGELALAVERPELYSISVNGTNLDTDTVSGWWVDRSLKKIPLDPNLLRSGENELTLTCQYGKQHPGFEIIYLLGDFGVKVDGTDLSLTKPVLSLKIGDWVKQGLPFYSGSLAYAAEFSVRRDKGEKVYLRLNKWRGVAVRVWVNGRDAGVIAWEPSELEITSLLDGEKAEVRIEILGHRRNSHGPLHHAEKWPMWTGPAEYITTGEQWTDDYQLVPCGLLQAPELIWRKS